MAKGNFSACIKETLAWEGGNVNHPADPGGLTSRGVTAARGAAYRKARGLPFKSVTQWSDAEVAEFYRSEFWDKMACEALDYGVDLAVLDGGVNSGPARGRKWLMASVGGSAVDTIKRICAARLSFVRGLKTWKVFGRGWARRIAGIEANAVSMWLLAHKAAHPTDVLRDEADAAEDRANGQAKAPGAVVAGGATTSGADAIVHGSVNWWLVGILAASAVAAIVIASIAAMRNRERAAAYRAAALRVSTP